MANELRPITESNNPAGTQALSMAKDIIKLDWIFSTPLEKLLLSASVLYTIYSLGKYVWGLL